MDDSGIEDGAEAGAGAGAGGRVRPCPGCGLADRVAGVPAVHQQGRGSVLEMSGVGDRRTLRPVDSGLARALAPAPSRSYASLGFGVGGVMTLLATVSLVVFGLFGMVAEHGYEKVRDAAAAAEAEMNAGAQEPEPSSTWITDEDGNPLLVTGIDEDAWGDAEAWGEEDPAQDPADEPTAAEAVPVAAEHDGFVDGLLALPWLAAAVTGGGTVLLIVLAVRKERENTRVRAGRPAAERVWARGWYCARCGTVHVPDADGAEGGPFQLLEFRRMVWTEGGYGHLADRHG
jgi:hypothetical protein